jgi:hypothetical protein
MVTTCFLLFVAAASLVALQNWRWGLLLCVLVGLTQDPIRKDTPNNPGYLVLAFAPIYTAMAVSLWSTRPALKQFYRYYPQVTVPALVYVAALAVSSLQTLTYGLGVLPLIPLGWLFYVGWVPAVLLGFFYLRKDLAELDLPLIFLGVLISLMLIGVPLEYAGVKFQHRWLGMVSPDGLDWSRRWYNNTQWVVMISGFFRAPEVMAWHAATLSLISIYLLIRRPAFAPLWLAQAAWGLACVVLSGRRKMFVMVFLFAGLFALLTQGRRRGPVLFGLLLTGIVLTLVLGSTLEENYLEAAASGFTTADARVTNHTYSGPLWLAGVVGPFGYGVGTKTQGAQLLNLQVDTPLVEGGFEKVLVELGIVGTLAVVFFAATLARLGYLTFRRIRQAHGDTTPLAALSAFVVCNVLTFFIAFQVYGDPFIGFLLGFAAGLTLSASRLATQRSTTPALAPPS